MVMASWGRKARFPSPDTFCRVTAEYRLGMVSNFSTGQSVPKLTWTPFSYRLRQA